MKVGNCRNTLYASLAQSSAKNYNENQRNHTEYCAVKSYNNCHFADDYNVVGNDYIGLVLGLALVYFGLGLGLAYCGLGLGLAYCGLGLGLGLAYCGLGLAYCGLGLGLAYCGLVNITD